MHTLADIEQRSDEIKHRLNQILSEIGLGAPVGREDIMSDLAEEMAKLLHEAKALQVSLKYFREMADFLQKTDCSGPH